jgi:hypothetical protein
MENLLTRLDSVLAKLQELKLNYQQLKAEKHDLELKFSDLKVEAEQYKLKLKEQKEGEGKDIKTTLSTSDNSETIKVDSMSYSNRNIDAEQIKLRLDGFIEDIDQCIHIIQTKENG